MAELMSTLYVVQDIVKYENLLNLSSKSQDLICSLLPPTAFFTYQAAVDASHPAKGGVSNDDFTMEQDVERSPATLDPMFFTNPFLLSAAQTFQDHISSGWLTKKAKESVEKFQEGVRDPESNMRAEWKDEEWRRDHAPPKRVGRAQLSGSIPSRVS